MRYISEIKLTELVKNFVEELNRTRDLKEKKNKIFALLSYFETLYLEEIEKLKKNQIKWILDSSPEDKEALCIIKDKDGYYIDSFNNLSSTDQKNIEKWAYLPL